MALQAFFTLGNFQKVLPGPWPYRDLPFFPLLIVGLAVMIYCLYRLPQPPRESDLTSVQARTLFFLLLAVGAYLRLRNPSFVVGKLCDDSMVIAYEVRRIMDYHDHPVLLAYGNREPMYDYLVALVWTLLPKITGFFIFRLTSSLIDLVTAWLLYLLGKEAGGRRMGLILMALGVLAKGLIDYAFFSVGVSTLILGCALTLLFLFRTLRKPSLRHFLQLALAVGFSSYTYAPYRLWIPTIVVGVMGWICLQKEGRPRHKAVWALAVGLASTWALFFLCQNSPLPDLLPASKLLVQGTGKWVLFALVGVAYAWVSWKHRTDNRVWGWSTAALLIALANTPLWLNPDYTYHTSVLSVFHPRFNLTFWGGLQNIGSNIVYAFRLLFGSCQNMDEQHPPLNYDSFTDFYVPLFAVWGLAVFLRKLDWLKIAAALFFGVGLLPFIMTPGPHTARLLGCLVPLFLVTAWGADRVWQTLAPTWPWGKAIGTMLLVGMGAWGLFTGYSLTQQWVNIRWADPLTADILDRFMAKDRVYLVRYPGAYFVQNPKDIICDGKDVHLADPSNPIGLAEGEEGKDLGVITWEGDKPTQERLQKEYPGLMWYDQQDQNHSPILRWAVVPFEKITESAADFFYIRRVPKPLWTRRFYSNYGLGRGLILEEDRAARWNDALPPCAQGDRCGRVSGTWEVQNPGTYVLRLQTGNPTQLFVDGRKVLEVQNHDRTNDKTASLDLPAGSHSVEEVTVFGGEIRFQPVTVKSNAEGWEKPLDELTGAPATVSSQGMTGR